MESVYRELLSVALEQLHEAQQSEAVLARRVEVLRNELRRYAAMMTDDARTAPGRPRRRLELST